VLASGSLLAVPFPLLRRHGRCLVDDHVVSVLPNLTSYALLAPHRGGTAALCVGDSARMSVRPVPEAAPVPLGALPGAAVEAAAVARLYGAEPLIGPEARYRTVRERLASAAVIHLATHGIVDGLSPLGSSILLADGATLTVAELLSLRMAADLVVLSACQTGTGTSPGGEELLGLARGLLAAGARAAVVSLWPVDDRATAVLMERFHHLYRRTRDAASALRDAQLWLRGLSRSGLEREHERLIDPTGAPPAAGPVPAAALRTVSTAPPAPRRPADPGSPGLWAPFILIGRG
jgi:CHAT domain-containing protein